MAAKTVEESSSLSSLPSSMMLDLLHSDDVLRAVLVRTCASDHPNLRLTCRRIRDVLDSYHYRQERSETGYAEVTTKLALVDEEDDDDDERGGLYRTHRVRIFVDGKPGGRASLTLVPRNTSINFHEICDMVSSDLQLTGCTFFDAHGKPRLPSVQAALKLQDNDHERAGAFSYLDRFELVPGFREMNEAGERAVLNEAGAGALRALLSDTLLQDALTLQDDENAAAFLYLDRFELDQEYRTTTETGAKAVRTLLNDTMLQEGIQWSVAVYIPDGHTQFSSEDETKERELKNKRRDLKNKRQDKMNAAEEEEWKKWRQWVNSLTKQDMRQFLRAGFQQTKETVFNNTCFFVFAVPSFLRDPMMSHDQALNICILEKPRRAERTGASKELLQVMVESCCERKNLRRHLCQLKLPPREQPSLREQYERLDQLRAYEQEFQEFLDGIPNIENMRRQMEEKKEHLTTQFHATEDESARQALKQQLDQADADINSMREVERKMHDVEQQLSKVREIEVAAVSDQRRSVQLQIESTEQQMTELDARVRTEVTSLVDEWGAVIIQSNAIHACAHNLEPVYIELLLGFVPETKKRGAINVLDQDGDTPLMTAAKSNKFNDYDQEIRMQTCEKLIELGADKNVVGASGETAFGKLLGNERDTRDSESVYGLTQLPQSNAHQQVARRMKDLLMPLMGPTPVDNLYMEDDEAEGRPPTRRGR